MPSSVTSGVSRRERLRLRPAHLVGGNHRILPQFRAWPVDRLVAAVSGDIVERLRQSNGFRVHHTDDGPIIAADVDLLSDAADAIEARDDEIVRLRAAGYGLAEHNGADLARHFAVLAWEEACRD